MMPAGQKWIFWIIVPCVLGLASAARGQILGTPQLASPQDQSAGVPLTLYLQWHPVGSATGYHLQLSSTADFSSLVIDNSATTDTFQQTPTLASGTTYYWRVSANYLLVPGEWSASWRFSTLSPPPRAPALQAPPDGASALPPTVTLMWNSSSPASLYHVQVSLDTTFGTVATESDNLADSVYTAASLQFNAKYFWRVMAKEGTQTSSWSDTWRFSTGPDVPPAPVLVSPADGAMDQPLSLSVTWNTSQTASVYRVEVATDAAFTNLVAEDSSTAATSFGINGLNTGTEYYWRVQGKNSAGWGAWSSVRHFQTVAPPPVPALSAPPDGATSQVLPVTLRWHPAGGSTSYDLQLGADSVFSSPARNDTALTDTFRQIGSLSNGTAYWWHVRSRNGSQRSAWSAGWQFATVPQLPDAPLLSAPQNGAAGQQLAVTLQWELSARATTYRIQVSDDSLFGVVSILDTEIAGLTVQAGALTYGTPYFWRVQGKNSGGGGPWSSTWKFTTVPAPPAAVALAAPLDGTTNLPTSPTLRWNPASNATTYRIQVSGDSLFGVVSILDTELAGLTVQAGALTYGTPYFWRVQGKNSGGGGPWSSTWKFTTVPAPPAAVALAAPLDGATNLPTSPTLRWNQAAGAASYILRVSADPSFSTAVSDTSLASVTCRVGPLAFNMKYYWKVVGANAGGTGAWSAAWSFSTQPASTTGPALISPPNGAVNQSTSPLLTWQPLSGTTQYHLQVSTDPLFGQRLIDDSSVTTTSRQLASLPNSTAYYWRVRGKFIAGYSSWSNTWAFTTIAVPPNAPSLASPPDGSLNEPASPILTWNVSPGAARYHLQVSTSQSFGVIVEDDTSLTVTARQTGVLAGNTTYFWRVNATNAGGTSSWSPPWSFTTLPSVPAQPTLLTPSDGAADQPTNAVFTWNAAAGANRYRLQISSNAGFTLLEFDHDSITGLSCTVNGLSRGSVHYWRLNAANSGGAGGWSVIRSFTTVPAVPPAPALSSPIEGSTNRPTTLVLAWSAATGATSYGVQLSSDSTFATRTVDDTNVVGTSRQVQGLAYNTLYTWRVRGKNSGGTGNWSPSSHFSTQPSSTQTGPVLASPPDGSVNMPLALLLTWNGLAGATAYELQVSSRSDFSSPVYDNSTLTSTSQSVGGLSNSTRYFWRVRGVILAIWSDWSTVWSFTTIPSPPPAVTLLAPADGAAGQPVNVTLSWNISSGATGYHLQCAADQTYGSRLVDDTTLTSASYALGPLSRNAGYYWRVRAKNDGGWGPFSSSRTFTTTAGASPVVSTDQATGVTESTATVHATVNPNGSSVNVTFEFGLTQTYGMTSVGTPSTVSGNTPVGIQASITGLSPGTTYHYRAVATDSAGVTRGGDQTVSTRSALYPASIDIALAVGFPVHQHPAEYSPADYRLIGVPGAGNLDMGALMSGTRGADWQLYWDDGAAGGGIVEYDGGQNFVALTGRAFWLINKGPWIVQRSLASAPLDSLRAGSISLHAGWNLITNPFTTSRPWPEIQQLNGITEPIYSFEGGFTTSDTLRPYEGYYFFNATGLTEMKVPYDVHTAVPKAAGRPDAGAWTIRIDAESADGSDRGSVIGVSGEAPAGTASPRYHKPRGFGNMPQVFFSRPEWDPVFSRFASDIRPRVEGLESWNMDVEAPVGTPVRLAFSGVSGVPPGYDAYLINEQQEQVVDLRSRGSYTLRPQSGTSRLTVIVGTANAAKERLRSMRTPSRYLLGRNYPNPFNPSTTIPVEVPASSAVELKIYNILGVEVRTLFSGELEAGTTAFVWDGKDRNKITAPSGIYFCRLTTASGISIVRKMVLGK